MLAGVKRAERFAAHDELGEVALEGLHPRSAAGHDRVAKLVRLTFADQGPHRVRSDQDLGCRAAPRALAPRYEPQGGDAGEHRGELNANLRVRFGRKGVDDAVDRLRSVVGVQRREDQVTRFGGGECRFHRRLVAHLADKNDVRVGAHETTQRLGKVTNVAADLAVRDE